MQRGRTASSIGVALGLLALAACASGDDRDHKRKLDGLVSRSAVRAEVARELGPGFTMYERDTPSWDALQSFLKREPASDLLPLRENATKYPKVMYYTTAWRMTWIFLDDKDVVRTYYVTAQ
jgi:hypothetical protein